MSVGPHDAPGVPYTERQPDDLDPIVKGRRDDLRISARDRQAERDQCGIRWWSRAGGAAQTA